MIRANKLCFSYGSQTIFDEADFTISDVDKVGIVGVNGAGKSTLFKLLLKELVPESGVLVSTKGEIGYLPQEISFEDRQKTVWDYLYSARPIQPLRKELDEVYEQLAVAKEEEHPALLERMEFLQSRLEHLDEYGAENSLLELISDMKIEDELLDMKLGDLSGGQKSKVAFAHVLFSNPEILMLDEPTNHLDVHTKGYVTDFLRKYYGCVIIISHDATFLNAVVNKILFVNKITQKISVYGGNYSDFKKNYAREQLLKEMRISRQEAEIKKLTELVRKAKQASRTNHNLKRLGKDREAKLAKAKAALETRDKEYKRVKLNLDPKREGGKIPVEAKDLTFGYPGKERLYDKLSFTVTANERFLIVGENGAGKSTLLKLIAGILHPNGGGIKFSEKTDLAYYAQELEQLDTEKTVLENADIGDFDDVKRRSILGNFLFSGDSVFKKVKFLSPGEKARVALCRLLMSRANLLLLDEPTNHLDPETQAVIGENFSDYSGTVIVVSHNPDFVEQMGITHMLILPEGKVTEYTPELLDYYYVMNTDFI